MYLKNKAHQVINNSCDEIKTIASNMAILESIKINPEDAKKLQLWVSWFAKYADQIKKNLPYQQKGE